MIAGITDWILSLGGGWALAVVFLGPALEASAFVGVVFPGEIVVVLGGFLAYQGRVSLPAVIAAAVLGAIVGDTIGYWVGRRWGRQVLSWIGRRLPFLRHRVDEDIERARAYLRRRGGVAVLLGRFAAALRATVPGLAGLSDMHYPTFLVFNAIGGAIWGTSFVLLGYFAGAAWERAASDASKVGLAVLALIIVALVGARVLRSVREANEPLGDRLARSGPATWFRRRYPRTSAWLARRVDAASPRGFLLSLIVSIGAFSVWLFGAMTQDVLAHQEAALLDPRILRFVVDHRTASLDAAAKVIVSLGSLVVLVPVVGLVVAWFAWRRGMARTSATVGLAVAAASALARIAQPVVARPRPPIADRVVAATGYSFPSTHAAQAMAGWGAVAILVALPRSLRGRVGIGGAAAALVLAIGASAIELGIAWWTDVVAGLALGAFCLCASAGVVCVRPPVALETTGAARVEVVPVRERGTG
jgi:membrane protein DedA with SNARE-associated domain/membrane-associated phospholipid phosphatase